MGSFLQTLQKQRNTKIDLSFFHNNSLSKLTEYYATFRSICETFEIDDSQFIRLFGNGKTDIFQIMDTDRNLQVDSLELFSGLTLLSKVISFEDKINFLFGLFDFNDLKSLSLTDLEFMFFSSCTAVSKIFNFRINNEDSFIQQFVREMFVTEGRVNISQIHKWANNSKEVMRFFQLILEKPEKNMKNNFKEKIYIKQSKKNELKTGLGNVKIQLKQQQFLLKCQKLFKAQDLQNCDLSHCDLYPSIDWVYGIRFHDVKQFLEYKKINQQEILIYFVGKIAVIYNIDSNKQKHYSAHRQEIISITTHNNIVATAEYGKDPQIHIWEYKSLNTLQKIKGTHKSGVHLLKFIRQGEHLVSCSSSQQSAVIIYQVKSGGIVFSSYCYSPAVQITELTNFTNNYTNEFLIASLYELYHYQQILKQNKISYRCQILKVDPKEQNIQISPITTSCFLMTNLNLKQFCQYDSQVQKSIYTGHQNGSVYQWDLQKLERQDKIFRQKNQILKIIPTQTHLIVVTDSSFINFWTVKLAEGQKIKTIDITQTQQQLLSFDIYECLLIEENKFLVMTNAGDLFFMSEAIDNNQNRQLRFSFNQRQYDIQNINHILVIPHQITRQKIIQYNKKQQLYITLNKSIRAIDLNAHKYIKEWNVGEKIVCFDVIFTLNQGMIIIAGTEHKKIHSYSNLSENPNKITMDANISTLSILSNDYSNNITILVGCQNRYLYKCLYSKNNLSLLGKHKLPYVPIYVCPFQNHMAFVLSPENKLFIYDSKGQHDHQAFQSDIQSQISVLKLFYSVSYQNNQIMLPLITGYDSKSLFIARKNGIVDCWRNMQQLEYKNKISLYGHNSPVSDLNLSQNQKNLISCGLADRMIIDWRLKFFTERKSAITPYQIKYEPREVSTDAIMLRKIEFCTFKNNILASVYDQHLQIRGIKNESIRALLKNNMTEWRNQNSNAIVQHEPPINLKLDYVFGIETFHTTGSVFAISDPKRFVYFVSKVVIIYNPALNTQDIYRGHKYKITCMILLDKNQTMASGQSALHPQIHIWSISRLQTIRTIATTHQWGIIDLVSRDNFILSYGIKYNQLDSSNSQKTIFCYQLTDYRSGYVLAKRQQKQVIYCMSINPNNTLEFVSCSQNKIIFWCVSFNNIYKKSVCWLDNDTATCCQYYLTESKENDLLIGTKNGAIGMVSYGRHYTQLKSGQKESKQVNCILILQRQKPQKQKSQRSKSQIQKPLFVIATDDNYLRIWSHKFEQLFCQQTKKFDFSEESKKLNDYNKGYRNCSVQSITEIQNNLSQSQIRLLIATRNGEIIQMVQNRHLINKQSSANRINFKATLFFRCNISQNLSLSTQKVFIAHHPKYQIIVTIGSDQNLLFWDTERRRFFHSVYLGQTSIPTAIKFNQGGDCLIVGYSDGLLLFMDSKISKLNHGKSDEKYIVPSLSLIKKQQSRNKHAVLNIQFSEVGDHLAVSYHSIKDNRSHSYIEWFISKYKQKSKNYSKTDNDKIFQSYREVPCPHKETVYHKEDGTLYGFAAYSMAFAQIQGRYYFLIYYQLIDEYQNRIFVNTEGQEESNYKVWDVSTSTVIANTNLIDSLKWKRFFIHNAVNCNYLHYERNLSSSIGQQVMLQQNNNNLLLSEMTNMNQLEKYLILGSSNGDIHLSRISALQYQVDDKCTPDQSQMFVAKTIPAHSSRINQIEMNHAKTVVYTTGQNDQCVMKWVVEESDIYQNNIQIYEDQHEDIFEQVPKIQNIHTMHNLYETKYKLTKINFRNIDFIDRIKVIEVIGRKSQTVRNNIKYDENERIIYSTGHLLVAYNVKKQIKQFIFVDQQLEQICHEINKIEISKNGKLIYSCHNGLKAMILIWQSSSKILLKTLKIDLIYHIVHITVNQFNNKLLVYGIDQELKSYLIMIDIEKEQILAVASYSHKQPWFIKAIQFVPKSQNRFVTCGVEQIKSWELIGQQLVYKSYETTIDDNINLCMCFAGEDLLTGCDNGDIIIWKGQPTVKKEHDSMVMCLSAYCQQNINKTIVVSGSVGSTCQVIVWKYQNSTLNVIQRIDIKQSVTLQISVTSNKKKNGKNEKKIYNKFLSKQTNKQNQKNEQIFYIQSLFVADNKFLIGTTKGDIFECKLEQTDSEESKQEYSISNLFTFDDTQQIKAFFFSQNQQELFQISELGLLNVWSLPNFKLIWTHSFQDQVIDMIYSPKFGLVYIAFRGQIRLFKFLRNEGIPFLEEIQESCLFFYYITHISISYNEKIIAIGIQKNSDNSKIIELFDVIECSLKVKQKHIKVDSKIQFIDFDKSVNSQTTLMVFKTLSNNNLNLYDINLETMISLDNMIAHDWKAQGRLYHEKTKILRDKFNQDYDGCVLKQILQLKKNHFLLIDIYGGIYYYVQNKLAGRCQSSMSSIDCVSISPSLKYLIVGSKIDHNIILLDISLCTMQL